MTKKKQTQEEETVSEETLEEDVEEAVEETVDQIQVLEEEIKTLNDRLLRNQAELQNFKRRINEERIRDRKYANLELVKKLLTPLDNFELGLMNEMEDGKLKAHAKGFDMIRRDLMEALTQEGLEVLNPENEPFDPNYHQAVSKEPAEGVEPNTIIEVYQKGYRFKDRVIRPAMVKVSE
ncbi:MAG: nucleotide exchange factor GrpE [Bacillota bacterium]